MLAAFVLAGLMFAGLAVVRIALQSQEQLHVQHVANHAADAAGIIATRDLNFKAITNRAMFANEVVIGQLMGLSSWFSMTSQTIENISLVTSWVPYLGQALRVTSQSVKYADRSFKSGLRAMLTVQQTVIKGLETAQIVFHAASWVATLTTMEDIVQQSHPDYELALLNHATLQSIDNVWLRLQTRRSGRGQEIEYIEMVGASRDGFTAERTYRWFSTQLLKGNKLGASEIGLQHGKVYWQAIDVTALQSRVKLTDIEIPLGWGGNYLDKPLPLRQPGLAYGGSYKVLPITSRLAARFALRMAGGHSVPGQFVLQANASTPTITIVVRRPEQKETGKPRLWGAGRTRMVYSRPARWWPRADQATERANLFNALWRRQKEPISVLELKLLEEQV